EIDLEIDDSSGVHVEHPPVYERISLLRVSQLKCGGLDNVDALLRDIQFNKPVVSLAVVGDLVEFRLVQAVNVPDTAQPRIQNAQILRHHRSLHAAAVVMSADDNMFRL